MSDLAAPRALDRERLREVLAVDGDSRPRWPDRAAVLQRALLVLAHGTDDDIDDLLGRGLLRGQAERLAEIEASLVAVPAGAFEMGTPADRVGHFCGESPRHLVELSPFELGRTTVTNRQFARFDPRVGDVATSALDLPVTSMSWFDAALFAMWVGCRLPTEAEWEFACGAESTGEWCCEDEAELPVYAWYSANADNRLHSVATREPNRFGLFDMHGNVWEWCHDRYDPDFYAVSGRVDPVNTRPGAAFPDDRVTRGGCYLGLAEMCRSRYRFHEADSFWACDLGFRLARGVPVHETPGGAAWCD